MVVGSRDVITVRTSSLSKIVVLTAGQKGWHHATGGSLRVRTSIVLSH